MATKMVNIRVKEELYKYLAERAEKEHRTLSNMIIYILLDDKERLGRTEVGHWISAEVRGDDSYICSECHSECCYVTTRYCPSCGARMENT